MLQLVPQSLCALHRNLHAVHGLILLSCFIPTCEQFRVDVSYQPVAGTLLTFFSCRTNMSSNNCLVVNTCIGVFRFVVVCFGGGAFGVLG